MSESTSSRSAIEEWLVGHQTAIQEAEAAQEEGGRVEAFLQVAQAHPLDGLTPQTLAAAAVTTDYEREPWRLKELLKTMAKGEIARAKAYADRVLLELVQNAEDAFRRTEGESDGVIHLREVEKTDGTWLELSYDGKPFDARDVDAFRLMYSSTKPEGVDQIGKFGVGIKAALSVADALELHSGGFHLRFEERQADIPFFLLPQPAQETAGGPGVVIRLRWRHTAEATQGRLNSLLEQARPESLLFLDRARLLKSPEKQVGLVPTGTRGEFATYRPSPSAQDEERWVLWDDRVAVGVRVADLESGGRLTPADPEPHVSAFFPIAKVLGGCKAWLHAPLPLSDDRESLAIASAADRAEVVKHVDALARCLASLPQRLAEQGIDLDSVPSVLLGHGPHQAPAEADGTLEADLLRQGVPISALIRKALIAELGEHPWWPCVGGLRRTEGLIFGGKTHALWLQAFPDCPVLSLPAPAEWLVAGGAHLLAVEVAGWTEFSELVDDRLPASDARLLPDVMSDEGAVAILRVAVRLFRRHRFVPSSVRLPLPCEGGIEGPFLLALEDSDLAGADLALLGYSVVSGEAFGEWDPAERRQLSELLGRCGAVVPAPVLLLEDIDRRGVADQDDALAAALRVGIRAVGLLGEDGVAPLAGVIDRLFRTRQGWGPGTAEEVAVRARRLRVPLMDGSWGMLGHSTVASEADLPASCRIDLTKGAELLGVGCDSVRELLLLAGAWPNVPVRTWFCLPLGGGNWSREVEGFQKAAPTELADDDGEPARAALFRLRDRRSARWPDIPGAPRTNAHGWEVSVVAGFGAGYWDSPVPLAQADLPPGLPQSALRRLVASTEWQILDSVPLWRRGVGDRAKNKAIGPRGWFPTLLVRRLRRDLMLPLARPSSGPLAQLEPEWQAAAQLVRAVRYPRGSWVNAAARHVPLLDEATALELPDTSLDRLHVARFPGGGDLRLALKVLLWLERRAAPEELSLETNEGRALRAAHREAWEEIERLTRAADPREQLRAALVDASELGWYSRSVEELPLLVERGKSMRWTALGAARHKEATSCAYHDVDANRANRRRFGSVVDFVAWSRVPARFAEGVGVPVFSPAPATYQTVAVPPEISTWLQSLVEGLVDWLQPVMTERAASGGQPMRPEEFEDRVRLASFRRLPVFGVVGWPTSQPVSDPEGGEVPLPEEEAPFRWDRRAGRGGLYVNLTTAPTLQALYALRWRLDTPLAEALASAGHAPSIQNLLRALDPDQAHDLANDPGLLDLTDKAPAGLPTEPEPDDLDKSDIADELRRVFRQLRTRAAAILLLGGDDLSWARSEAERAWETTMTWHRLVETPGGTAVVRLQELFGPVVAGDPGAGPLGDQLIKAVDDPMLLEVLVGLMQRRGGLSWNGKAYSSWDELTPDLVEHAETLALPEHGLAVARVGSSTFGNQGAGGGSHSRFSKQSSVTGRLGELYARRWATRFLADGDPARVIDVSTPETRGQAIRDGLLPADYTAGSPHDSPGVDFLVFAQTAVLPLGLEVKARRGTGPIAFAWTRNERERCRRVASRESGSWPLADYRALIVSRLAEGSIPEVVLMDAAELLEGARPAAFEVRAQMVKGE
jgi:hypothetical protein